MQKAVIRCLAGLSVWLMVSMASWSATVTVEVDGTFYDVSTITGSFRDNSALLMNQVYWEEEYDYWLPINNSILAEMFADAVGDALGTTDCGPSASYPSCGPQFAFQLYADPGVPVPECGLYTCAFRYAQYQEGRTPGYWTAGGGFDIEYEWAVAIPSQVPIPPAAWLFGSALLGLGIVKRRKT